MLTQFFNMVSVIAVVFHGAPLKIVDRAIRPVFVLVIDVRKILWIWNKSLCDKSVHVERLRLSVIPDADLYIPRCRNGGACELPGIFVPNFPAFIDFDAGASFNCCPHSKTTPLPRLHRYGNDNTVISNDHKLPSVPGTLIRREFSRVNRVLCRCRAVGGRDGL